MNPALVEHELSKLITDRQIVVHPIVLLSVVDHYSRAAKGTTKRVAGTLIGEMISGELHVTNSFAVPFEEDTKDPILWFFDHDYHESMFAMHRKINRKETVVGWYSTGPKIKPIDLDIHDVYRKYHGNPVYLIVDVKPDCEDLPISAYVSRELPTAEQTLRRTFVHVPASIGSFEIEEIGIEHLLRDLQKSSAVTLSHQVSEQFKTVVSQIAKLREIAAYLQDVNDGKLVPSAIILYKLQNIFSLLPDLQNERLNTALSVQTNDNLLGIYVGSVLRLVLALHNLINNKMENKTSEKTGTAGERNKKAVAALED